MQDFIKDDMIFKPHTGYSGGYHCNIRTKAGVIAIRYGGHGLFTTPDKPYEVRYPNGEIKGRQTADDIFDYVKKAGTIEQRG